MINWAYGVTTVHSRSETTLPRTLKSLFKAGFDKPRLFVDGHPTDEPWKKFGLDITLRYPKVKTYGNWFLSLIELYIRHPLYDRYAIFQDDFLAYRNLKCYLDKCRLEEKTYWNLHTLPHRAKDGRPIPRRMSQKPPPTLDYVGWYPSDQMGRGALALVFTRSGVIDLMKSDVMVYKPQSLDTPVLLNEKEVWTKANFNTDGAISDALCSSALSYIEYVHSPSLIYHIGDESSMGSGTFPESSGFRGENFDALDFFG